MVIKPPTGSPTLCLVPGEAGKVILARRRIGVCGMERRGALHAHAHVRARTHGQFTGAQAGAFIERQPQ